MLRILALLLLPIAAIPCTQAAPSIPEGGKDVLPSDWTTAAHWRSDWSEKPNATVWRTLVGGSWRTRTTCLTNALGQCTIHGHRGLYEVTVEADGKSLTQPFQTEGGSTVLRIIAL